MECKITELSNLIIKDGKMTATDVIDFIGKAMENEKPIKMVYRELYENAYGKKITRELADMWVKSMSITDGSERNNGIKWSLESASEVGNKIGFDWNKYSKIDFFVAMNMVYSDYFRSAKKYDLQNDSVYFAELAKDWLCDEDAPCDKLYKYYFNIICSC